MPIEFNTMVENTDHELILEIDQEVIIAKDPKEIKPLTITENGVYEGGVEDGKQVGFSPVTVDIAKDPKEIKPLTITENGVYEGGVEDGKQVGFSPVTVNISVSKSKIIKELVDLRGNTDWLFNKFPRDSDEELAKMLEFNVTENATSFLDMFNMAYVKKVPCFDISKTTTLSSLFRCAVLLLDAPILDTKHIENFQLVFNQCSSIAIIPQWDVRNGTNFTSAFNACHWLSQIWFKNIKANIQVASGDTWGSKLTPDSLIHLIRELRDTGSTLTLTIGNVNIAKLANTYVRIIEITDEMRAEDDLIDEKLPFEVCESTDEGAMLIDEYVWLKNWQIR